MPDRYEDYECYPLLTNGYFDPPIVSRDTSHPPSGGSMDKKTRLWSQVVAQSRKPARGWKNQPAVDNGQLTGSEIVKFPQVHKAPSMAEAALKVAAEPIQMDQQQLPIYRADKPDQEAHGRVPYKKISSTQA